MPEAKETIEQLGNRKVNGRRVSYELICGIDWRILTKETAALLYNNRFTNIRLAWDYGMECQFKIKDAIGMLLAAGYKNQEISVFMVCNWKITFDECCQKLDLLKIWRVKVNDCWFDNQLSPNIKPLSWAKIQIKVFP